MLGAAACVLLLAGCAPKPQPAASGQDENDWSFTHEFDGRIAFGSAISLIRAYHGDCTRVDYVANNGETAGTKNYLVRCDNARLYSLARSGGTITVQPLTMSDDQARDAAVDEGSLDGAYGAQLAFDNISHYPDMPCKTLTAFAYVKRAGGGDGPKAYKAQCDGKAWYVLLQQGAGIKTLVWSGVGEPH